MDYEYTNQFANQQHTRDLTMVDAQGYRDRQNIRAQGVQNRAGIVTQGEQDRQKYKNSRRCHNGC